MEPVLGIFDQETLDDDESFDEAKVPSSGYEYLRRVHLQARHCPDVVVADLDTKSFSSRQTVHVNEKSGWSPAPQGFAPPIDWQSQQAAEFADVRQRFAQWKSQSVKVDSTSLTLPKKNDSLGWCCFCLGDQIAAKISCRKDGTKTHENMYQTPASTQKPSQEGTLPLLSVLQHINQATLLQVFEYHVTWLEEIGFSHHQGRWFYALLVCLEKPLLPETTYLLRTLARLCAALRASLDSALNDLVSPLNLIITIVSRYFGQSDLADPG